MAVFGAGSMALMVVIILNIVTNVLMYTLGIYLISGDKKAISLKKAFLNPVLISFVVGVVANLLNVKGYVPEVATYSTHFSNLVTPISMTILGMKMGQVDLGKIFVMPKMYYSAFIKLIVVPALIIAIMFAVKGAFGLSIIDDNMFLGVFIAFSMPTAGLASALADGCNGDIENSVTYTLGSTILSVLTIPLLYMLLTMMLA
jgi:predicted permease